MKSILPACDLKLISRREVIRMIGAPAALAVLPSLRAASTEKDSLPMQFYKSLTEEQHGKICLPVNHPKRQFVSNWWYICPDQRLHTFYTKEQQDLVRQIFESLHSPEHREKMSWQVQKDLMGDIQNTPSVGFFGTPKDKSFEFIYTGHHVTRRCHAHTDKGLGFGGAPIFYGNFAKAFRETKDHEGNPQRILQRAGWQTTGENPRRTRAKRRKPRHGHPEAQDGFAWTQRRGPYQRPAGEIARDHATDAGVLPAR